MKKNLFALYDRESGFYYPPFCSNDDPQVCLVEHQRALVINHDASVKGRLHQCDLFQIGTYDDEAGIVQALDKPSFIGHLEDPFRGKSC